MVKRGSSTFSAASVTNGSVVLSCVIENNVALEAEISLLRHHPSVLSQRLHFITIERDGLQDMITSTIEFEEEWGRAPLSEEVAGEEREESRNVAVEEEVEEAAPSVAGEEEEEAELTVADEAGEREENTAGEMEDVEFVPAMAEDCNRFKVDLVEEVDSIPDLLVPSCVDGLVRMREVRLEVEGGWPSLGNPVVKEIDRGEGGVRNLGSSVDEDTIVGGIIVAGGASQKAKMLQRMRQGEGRGKTARVKLLVGMRVGKLILFGHA